MRRLSQFLIGLVALGLVGGVIFLMTWDIPPPTAEVERTLPNDRFPK